MLQHGQTKGKCLIALTMETILYKPLAISE